MALAKPPTAIQAVAEVHDTLYRDDDFTPLGLGVGSTVQVVPFHFSATLREFCLWEVGPFPPPPTAVQAVAEVHDTLYRIDDFTPLGLGVGSTVQVVPFHFSATVKEAPVVGPSELEVPTAVQAVAEVHETPSRFGLVAPVGVGVVWIVQAVPFHRSAMVLYTVTFVDGTSNSPTAVQAVAEVHETLSRPLLPGYVGTGLGVGSTVQVVPFHRSAKVTESALALM